jgi:hypothetical protein
MDKEPKLSGVESPLILYRTSSFVPDLGQHPKMALAEITHAPQNGATCKSDEVERRDRGQIPLHVRNNDESVLRVRVVVKHFVSLGDA